MAYYDTIRTYERNELGVRFLCHVAKGGYTETVATIGSDAPWIFDHTSFCSDKDAEQYLRNHLRQQARWAKKRAEAITAHEASA